MSEAFIDDIALETARQVMQTMDDTGIYTKCQHQAIIQCLIIDALKKITPISQTYTAGGFYKQPTTSSGTGVET